MFRLILCLPHLPLYQISCSLNFYYIEYFIFIVKPKASFEIHNRRGIFHPRSPDGVIIEECFLPRFNAGICVEALCSPTSIQPLDTVQMCLKAVYTLLDDPWPRSCIGTDQSLAVELLNVLHR